MTVPDPHDPTTLAAVARAVAVEAADVLARGLGEDRRTVDTKSSPTDMVTEMDRASEALIVDRLSRLRPDDAIVGEEGADRAGTSGVTWVVDPLDGTTNYLYRLPGWNVSIGAEIDGIPVAGCVVVPGHGHTFLAASGHGASLDGRALRLGDAAPLDTCLLGTGFNYDPDTRRRQAEAIARLIASVRDIRRSGAAATDLCSVAAGTLDAYVEHGLAPWDRVAGTVIAREAGARVEVEPSPAMGHDLVIAAHPDRFDELVTLLDTAGLRG